MFPAPSASFQSDIAATVSDGATSTSAASCDLESSRSTGCRVELVVVVVVLRNVVVVSVVCVVIVVVVGSDVVDDVDSIVVVESEAKFPVVIVDVRSSKFFAVDVSIDVGDDDDDDDEGVGGVSIVVVIFIRGKVENSVFNIVGAVVVDVIFGIRGFTGTDKNKIEINSMF